MGPSSNQGARRFIACFNASSSSATLFNSLSGQMVPPVADIKSWERLYILETIRIGVTGHGRCSHGNGSTVPALKSVLHGCRGKIELLDIPNKSRSLLHCRTAEPRRGPLLWTRPHRALSEPSGSGRSSRKWQSHRPPLCSRGRQDAGGSHGSSQLDIRQGIIF